MRVVTREKLLDAIKETGNNISEKTLDKYMQDLEFLKYEICEYYVCDEEFYYQLLKLEKILNKIKSDGKYSLDFQIFLKNEVGVCLLKQEVMYRRECRSGLLEFSYENALQLYNEIEKKAPYSQLHVLIAVYVLMPPLRDNWGKVLICNKPAIVLKGMEKPNYYLIPEKKFYLFDQKMHQEKGVAIVTIPDQVHEIIMKSIEIYPRKYIITKFDGLSCSKDECYSDGKLSEKIRRCLGSSINKFRYAYTTQLLDDPRISWLEKLRGIECSLHGIESAINYYYFPVGK